MDGQFGIIHHYYLHGVNSGTKRAYDKIRISTVKR